MRKLEEWCQAWGRSYQSPPQPTPQKQPPTNPLPHRRSFWTAIEEDDINSLVTSVESALTDCLRLEQEACPAEEVSAVLDRLPLAECFAKFWICKSWLIERQGNREMMPLAEAVEEFQTVLFEILKRKKKQEEEEEEESKHAVRFHPVLEEVEPLSGEEGSEVGEGVPADPVTLKVVSARFQTVKDGFSVVKYRITATPSSKDACRSELLLLSPAPCAAGPRPLRDLLPAATIAGGAEGGGDKREGSPHTSHSPPSRASSSELYTMEGPKHRRHSPPGVLLDRGSSRTRVGYPCPMG
ncbi:Cytoskeleton-associated protein 2-like [Acipenser ruthenus]|uniref:Cytoskeleton-associated protein 2-like n=1 Tax=Acipenser ruthenus TaxID=7906 RepID=A0A444UYN4_ACIRT|nr:Cytoskeleton-associated protein 2-like [Acipenser ruthenus]